MRPAVPLDPSFQRAFVSFAYLLGTRGDALLAPLETPCQAVEELERTLAVEDRQLRARALGTELQRVARALDERRLG